MFEEPVPGGVVVTNWVGKNCSMSDELFSSSAYENMIMFNVAIKRFVGLLIKSVVLNWAKGSSGEMCVMPGCTQNVNYVGG